MKVSVIGNSPTQTDEYQLERRATELKRAGDLHGAIECLQQAQLIRGILRSETRLAKFLQEAGRFDEAIQEITEMIADSLAWADGNFDHKPRSVRRCQQAGRLTRLHDDAALICKREGAKEQLAHHEQESRRWRQLHNELKDFADREKHKR